jgi:hypothetical protein
MCRFPSLALSDSLCREATYPNIKISFNSHIYFLLYWSILGLIRLISSVNCFAVFLHLVFSLHTLLLLLTYFNGLFSSLVRGTQYPPILMPACPHTHTHTRIRMHVVCTFAAPCAPPPVEAHAIA